MHGASKARSDDMHTNDRSDGAQDDGLDTVPDAVAAAAFRRLVMHLRHRDDAQNVDIMGLAGFCRNCLGDWVAEASDGAMTREAGRAAVYGMPYADWKAQHQQPATAGQIARMEASLKRNP